MRTRAITGPRTGRRQGPAIFPAMCRALRDVVLLFMLGAGFVAADADALAETVDEMVDAMNRTMAEAGKEWGLASNPEKVQIFKDYTYGMSRQEVRQRSGAWPCDDPDLKDALCAKKPISFAGTTWQQVFSFDASGLDQVLPAKEEIEPEELFQVLEVLGAENSIVSMSNGLMPFDLLEAARVIGVEEAQNMGRQYLVDSLQNGSTFEACLFPNTYIRKLLREKSPSAFASLKDAPGNLRVIQFIISDEDEMVALIFSTPVQFLKKLGKKNLRERF